MIEIGTEIDPGLAAIDLQGYGCESLSPQFAFKFLYTSI